MKSARITRPDSESRSPRRSREHALSRKQIGMPLIQRVAVIHSQLASRITWHTHDVFEVLFLLEGATTYEFDNGRTVELPGGHFLVIPPGLRHRGRFNVRHPVRLCGVMFEAKGIDALRHSTFTPADLKWLHQRFQAQAMSVCRMSPELRRMVFSLQAHGMKTGDTDQMSAASLRANLCQMLIEAARLLTAPRAIALSHAVQTAIEYLQQHFANHCTMKDVAAVAGCTRARFFNAFKDATGLSPNDYLQRLRVREAQTCLRETDRSITLIAQQCGFSTSQYFCNVFRKFTGSTPTEFREKRN